MRSLDLCDKDDGTREPGTYLVAIRSVTLRKHTSTCSPYHARCTTIGCRIGGWRCANRQRPLQLADLSSELRSMPFKQPSTLLGEKGERNIESISTGFGAHVSDLVKAVYHCWTYMACTRSFRSAYAPVYMTSAAHNLVPGRKGSSK